jgi:arsenate reductase
MSIEISSVLRRSLHDTTARLTAEFSGVFSPETVARYVEKSFVAIADRPTIGPNFLPVIIERFARQRLNAVAQAEGRVEKAFPEVLFVCEHNAGRSQIAAALTHRLSNGWVGVRSAGHIPTSRSTPSSCRRWPRSASMSRLTFPKPLTDEVVRAADVVVTLGCGDACPVYPGKRYEDWPVADPAGQPLGEIREIRYTLYHLVWELLKTLVPSGDVLAIQRPGDARR